MPRPFAVHLLLGPEEGEKTRHIQRIAGTIEKETGEAPQTTRYYPFEGDLGKALDGLRTVDLFASHQMALINDAHDLKKPDVDALRGYLDTPAPDTTIILSSPRTRLRDISARIVKKIPTNCRQTFWELFDNQKTGWLMKFFASHKIRISPEAADLILDMVENNTRDLRAECEKIALYIGPDTDLAVEAIEEYLYHSKQENVFTLFDRVATRDLEACLEVVQKIELSGGTEATSILGGLLWQFRRLLSLHLLVADRRSVPEAFSELNIRGKRIQRTYGAAMQSFTTDDVRDVISLIAEYDGMLRSHRTDLHDLLLSLFLYHGVARGRQ